MSKGKMFLKQLLVIVVITIMVIQPMPISVLAANDENPDDFTMQVKDMDDAILSGATVSYQVFNDSALEFSGESTTDENGYIVIASMADYTADILNEEVQISYTVTKTGYQTKTINLALVESDKDNVIVYLSEFVNVTVSKTGNGTATVNEVEVVEVAQGETVTLNVVPDTGSQIASVKINGAEESIADQSSFTKNILINEETTIEVSFELAYTINLSYDNTFGTVTVDHAVVGNGSDALITINSEDGYVLESVVVNEVEDTSAIQTGNNTLELTLSNVTEDKTVIVSFMEMTVASTATDYVFNSEDAVRSDIDANLYVFGKNDTVIFSTTQQGIKVNGIGSFNSNTVTITNSIIVTNIQLFFKEDGESRKRWHYVEGLPTEGISTQIDKTNPIITLTPEDANSDGFYNTDIEVTVQVDDPIIYSGVEQIEYWVESEGTETQRDTITLNGLATDSKVVIVNADLNTSNDVDLFVKAKDIAGNETTSQLSFMINSVPYVTVSYSSTESVDKNGNTYFHEDTNIEVSIKEESDVFDATAATAGILISEIDVDGDATPLDSSTMVSEWISEEDVHTASILFEEEGKYKIELDYTNLEGINTMEFKNGSDNPIAFTLDKTNLIDTGSIGGNSKNGIYRGDVQVNLVVSEAEINAAYSGIKKISYRVLNMGTETQNGILFNFDNEIADEELVKNWTGSLTVDSEQNNSNNVVVEIYMEDNASNVNIKMIPLNIDITSPIVEIKYDKNTSANGKYYSNSRVATIVVTERNFNANSVNFNITNSDGVMPVISGWTKTAGSGNQDNSRYTATITYEADGDYTFGMQCSDMGGNGAKEISFASGTQNGSSFTIDKTIPLISVSYDNNKASNSLFFNQSRTAIVTILEHNFDIEKVQFEINASIKNGSVTTPAISWKHIGNSHVATILYTADGDYTFNVSLEDAAGNASGEVNYGKSISPKAFTIDKHIDEVKISGIQDGRAYREEIIPGITFSDINFSDYEVKLYQTNKNGKNVDVTEQFIGLIPLNNLGGSSTFDTFEQIQSNDGIYKLYIKYSDLAGNESEKTIHFTANRFGSTYVYGEYLSTLILNGGAYLKSVSDDLIITEYNPDRLLEGSLEIEITCDGKPLEDINYKVSPIINASVEVGTSGWYQYQYVISKDNFVSDGVYKIFISSKDATGNVAENTSYEGQDIVFRVDNTATELTSIVGLEEKIINAHEISVSYTLYDTIGVKSVTIYVDGKAYKVITEFGDQNNYTDIFTIPESTVPHSVRFVVEDLAGNITDTDAESFTCAYSFNKNVTVSTNAMVRWYANKTVFIFTIIGAGLFIICSLGIVFFIKRKNK